MEKRILLLMLVAASLLSACKGKSGSDYEFINNHTGRSSEDSATLDTSRVVKLVKTAQMNFKVKSVGQASERISDLTRQSGGTIMHRKVQFAAGQTRNVHLSNHAYCCL